MADKNLLNKDSLKTGDELSDEDKNSNLEKVVDASDKLGCPTKLKPTDILKGKKKKDQELVGDILDKVMVPHKQLKIIQIQMIWLKRVKQKMI